MPYKPIHAWKRKDSLPPRNPDGSRNENKILKGAQLQDEFDAIADGLGSLEGHIEEIQGEIDNFPNYVEEAPINGTVYARANAEWVAIPTGGDGCSPLPPSGGVVFWDEILEKPESISNLGFNNVIDGGSY